MQETTSVETIAPPPLVETYVILDSDEALKATQAAYNVHQAALSDEGESRTRLDEMDIRLSGLVRRANETVLEGRSVRTSMYRKLIADPESDVSKDANRLNALQRQAECLAEAREIAEGIDKNLLFFLSLEAAIRTLHADSMLWQTAAKFESIKRGKLVRELALQEGVVPTAVLQGGKTASMELRAMELLVEANEKQSLLDRTRATTLPRMITLSERFGYSFEDVPAPRI